MKNEILTKEKAEEKKNVYLSSKENVQLVLVTCYERETIARDNEPNPINDIMREPIIFLYIQF